MSETDDTEIMDQEEKNNHDHEEEQEQEVVVTHEDDDPSAGAAGAPPPLVVSWKTSVRQQVTPYLPPPMVQFMKHSLDPTLEPLMGPEPSVTVIGTLCLAVLLWYVLGLVRGGGSGGKSGSAIQHDDDDDDEIFQEQQASEQPFDKTLVLCGPSLAGKTSLFYELVYGKQHKQAALLWPTVASIKTNTGYMDLSTTTSGKTTCTWKVLDTPGHWGATKFMSFVNNASVDATIVVVLDATQPVAKVADYVFALLVAEKPIVVACHKCAHPKAKNTRRLKLQLRTELERLAKLSSDKDFDAEAAMESSSMIQLISTSVEDPPVMDEFKTLLQQKTT